MLDQVRVSPATIVSMEERVFFNENGVLVSNARFVTKTATYALAQISSVRMATVQTGGGPVAYLLTAVAGIAAAALFGFMHFPMGFMAGAAVGFVGLVGAPFAKKTFAHHIFITTSAGELARELVPLRRVRDPVLVVPGEGVGGRGVQRARERLCRPTVVNPRGGASIWVDRGDSFEDRRLGRLLVPLPIRDGLGLGDPHARGEFLLRHLETGTDRAYSTPDGGEVFRLGGL